MSNAAAFLVLYPHLAELQEAGERHWHHVTNFVMRLRLGPDDPWPLPEGPPAKVFLRNEYAQREFERFQRALEDEHVRRLNLDFVEELDESNRLLIEGEIYEDFRLAEDYLVYGLDRLNELLTELSVTAFGEWGAHWFRACAELVGFATLQKTYTFAKPDQSATDHIPALVGASLSDPLELDDQTFAVQWGDRGPCVLGNTKPFHLLRVLTDSPNTYISFLDIAERMGGDEGDVDNLPVIKHRLCSKLRKDGYATLVRCIKTQALHYGLFLRQVKSK